jgi:NAD+ kinase
MAVERVGLVVHPRRDVDGALGAIRAWASSDGVVLGQVRIAGQIREVADAVDVDACDMLFALGGDGTTLAALHAAAPVSRPVLGVACGSIGVLTAVAADRLPWALEQIAAGRWKAQPVPGLELTAAAQGPRIAINDFAVVRDGIGQVIVRIQVDDELYARTAGDGVVIATPLGSSAYTMAAGGPILAPGAVGMVVTPLADHGGAVPPLVVGPESHITVAVEAGYGGSRFELDGQELPLDATELSLRLRREYATLATLADQEPMLTALRRRGLVLDSPRIVARDKRDEASRRG